MFKHLIPLFCLLLASLFPKAQTIVINELVADNSLYADSDGDFSDWIELYNSSNTPVDLENYCLSDDATLPNKWYFPAVTIPANGFLIVFASSKNRTGVELHTNFKISSSGEAVYLSDPLMNVIDQTPVVVLGKDVPLGRLPDGSANLTILPKASPGSSNNANNELHFSHEGGFYPSEYELEITSLNNDPVYYTLDGSVPTINSSLLTGKLLIEEQHDKPNTLSEIQSTAEADDIVYKEWVSPSVSIDKAVILRCASYKNGVRSSNVYTQTYFVDPDVNKYKLPVISLVTDAKHFFGQDSGIYVPGIHFDPDVPNNTGNFYERGDDWERPVHIEYYEVGGNLGFKQQAGVKIHGAISRQGAQKSLRMYARSSYGKKHFDYPLLPQRTHSAYKRFILRTPKGPTGDQVCFKDELANDIVQDLNVDYQAYRPAILFLNGEYWGLYSIRDRLDDYYIEYTYNVDKDEIEFFEDNPTHFNDLITFIENNGLDITANFDYVKTQIDLDNFIDTYIAEMYLANYDWPGNNTKLWRPKTQNGKWRWLFYDLDFTMVETNKSMFEHTTSHEPIIWSNTEEATFLFRSLLESEEFVDQFLARYYELMKTDFNRTRMFKKLDSLKLIYSSEIDRQSERWDFPWNYEKWEKDLEKYTISFLNRRACAVEKNISDFFDRPKLNFNCFDTLVNPLQDTDLILAPNPCSDYFFLYNNSNETIEGEYFIYNLLGQLYDHKKDIVLLPGEKQYFSILPFPDQHYYLKFSGTENCITKKIVIARNKK